MQEIKTIDKQFYRILGMRLRIERENKRLTLNDVAKKTGFSKSIINHWELGYNKIKPRQYQMLSEVLDLSSQIKIDVRIKK